MDCIFTRAACENCVENEMKERKTMRLAEYGYSEPGGYFVTLTVQNRLPLLGQILDGEMVLSQFGTVVERAWLDLPKHYSNVILDHHIVMPDHFHGILFITDRTGHGLPEIMRGFKTFSARRINLIGGTPGEKVWQRSFYDRILRDDRELNAAREYIRANPLRWEEKS